MMLSVQMFSLSLLVASSLFYQGLAQEDQDQDEKEDLIQTNKEHLKEHLIHELGFSDEGADSFINAFSGEMHFFLLNDSDNNAKLDGLEILQGLRHDLSHEHEEEGPEEDDYDETVKKTDFLLQMADRDKDGFIEFPEFATAFGSADQARHFKIMEQLDKTKLFHLSITVGRFLPCSL